MAIRVDLAQARAAGRWHHRALPALAAVPYLPGRPRLDPALATGEVFFLEPSFYMGYYNSIHTWDSKISQLTKGRLLMISVPSQGARAMQKPAVTFGVKRADRS